MLKTLSDLTIAHYNAADSVKASEVQQADIIQVLGRHPFGIYHPTFMRWKCFLDKASNIQNVIRSKKEQGALEKNTAYFSSQGYSIEIRQMKKEDHYSFKTLYQETTLRKQRAVEYELDDKILGRILAGIPVYCVGLYQESVLESALIFTINNSNQAIVSFGAKKTFDDVRGGVGGVLEWKLLQYCFERGVSVIDHGRNPNPMGLTCGSGLFEFKARYGNSAFPEGEWVTTFLKNPSVLLSDLVFVTILNGEVGYKIVTEKSQKEVENKYKTNEINTIEVTSLGTFSKSSTEGINQLLAQAKV